MLGDCPACPARTDDIALPPSGDLTHRVVTRSDVRFRWTTWRSLLSVPPQLQCRGRCPIIQMRSKRSQQAASRAVWSPEVEGILGPYKKNRAYVVRVCGMSNQWKCMSQTRGMLISRARDIVAEVALAMMDSMQRVCGTVSNAYKRANCTRSRRDSTRRIHRYGRQLTFTRAKWGAESV